MKFLHRSFVGVILILLASLTSAAQTINVLRTEATTIRSYDGRSLAAELLRLAVPEHRASPGRTLVVAALRVPSTAAKPGPPIFFLMGGPGIPGTAMAQVPPYFTLFQRLSALADVIIVDQRGVGRSEPTLDCPFEGTLPADAFTSPDKIVDVMRQKVAHCADSWRNKGFEPLHFNTLESANDINDLRQALKVDKIDLLAFSYGSRLALAFMHRHGLHANRIVLQGVNGPALVVKRPGPVARKLQRTNELIRQDASWKGGPNLLTAARMARARLQRAPASITVNDRRSGQPIKLMVGREGFDAIVSLNLDDARLPALLVSVAAGDDSLLTRFVEAAWNGLGGGTVSLMARAMNCAADRPPARWLLVNQESKTAPFGAPIDNSFLTDEFCRAVGFKRAPVEFSKPVRSAAPVLILTGALDATNPIENAQAVARGLPNAIMLEVENAAHEALTIEAVQNVVVAFLSGTDVRGRQIIAPAPRFPTLAEALRTPSPRR